MLNEILTENTNIIEIYFLNTNICDENIINIEINENLINKIKNKYKLTKETTHVYFIRDNISYVYDLSNDNQYVFLRKLENSKIINRCNKKYYIIAFNDIKMQTHSFPCSNDISKRIEYKLFEYKINNRINLIIRNNNIYLQYKHSKEVDIEKIEEIINKIFVNL